VTWDFSTEPEFQKKLDWMRDFVREEVWPLEVIDTDLAGFTRLVRPLQDQVKAQGLWATHLPPEHGGQGYGQVKLGLMHEIEGASMWAPVVFGNQAPDSGNSEILAMYGSAEQKQKWLEPLLAGDMRSAFSMTEPAPGAGADPTMLKTTARREGHQWVINGHKWFTSNAMVADFLIAMVVTGPENENPYSRASMIIVPRDAPGLNVVRNIPNMASEHEPFGFGHSEVLYEDCRVPVENLLGPEGAGFLIAQMRLGPGRIHHCMRWLGVARRAFDMLCERSLYRQAHGSTLPLSSPERSSGTAQGNHATPLLRSSGSVGQVAPSANLSTSAWWSTSCACKTVISRIRSMVSRRSRPGISAARPRSRARSQSWADSTARAGKTRRWIGVKASRAAASSGVIGRSVMGSLSLRLRVLDEA